MDGQWNLILVACERCNREKADLEDDISAITMQPDAWGQHPANDPLLVTEAERKGRGSRSRRTTKRVKDSSETVNVRTALGANGSMELGLTCPPQPKDERVVRLSLFHSMGFFFWITYNQRQRAGRLWSGKFLPVHWTLKGDWGNPVHKAFADAVSTWPVRVFGIAGGGFFKVLIRKHPTEICWSWAYEWNQNLRIIGFLGEAEPARMIAAKFPKLGGFVLRDGNNVARLRAEVPLGIDGDSLFSVN